MLPQEVCALNVSASPDKAVKNENSDTSVKRRLPDLIVIWL